MKCVHPVLKYGQMFGCGKCYFCQQKKRQELYCRLKIEQYYSRTSLFVTLTYAPEHIPSDGYVNRRDIQLYMKRLRKYYPSKSLKYLVTAEYGGRTGRCHYHFLLFSTEKMEDLSPIFDCWDKGFVEIGEVTERRIMYMSKYCHKVLREDDDKPDGKTFRLFSRSLGEGFLYDTPQIERMLERLDFSKLHFFGHEFVTPRYYRDKLKKLLTPERLEEYNTKVEEQARQSKEEYFEKYPQYSPAWRRLTDLEDMKLDALMHHYRTKRK